MVLVTGSVKAHGFTNRDGVIAASLEITADQVKFLSGSNKDTEMQGGQPQASSEPVTEEDIPF